jgi:hypothetical protein
MLPPLPIGENVDLPAMASVTPALLSVPVETASP